MIGKFVLLAASALALAGAGQASAAGCQLQKIAELPVTMAGLRPLIPAKLNGKDALFLVDTGAFFSVLTPEAVAAYGVRTYAPPMGLTIRGVGGGEAQVRVGKVAEFTYAGVPLKGVEFLVTAGTFAPEAAGLIGQNVLGVTDVEFDLANGVIRLFLANGGCGDKNLAYWSAGKASSILTIEDQTPVQPHVVARAKIDGHSIRVMFDTGSPVSYLSNPAAARAGVKPSSEGVVSGGITSGFGNRMLESSIAPFDSFAIGDEEVQHTRLRTADIELGQADMLIGSDFFLSHRVMIAKSQRRVYFTYNGGPVFRLDGQDTQLAKADTAPASGPAAGPTGGTAVTATSDGPKDAEEFSRRGAASAARRDFPAAIADFSRAIELEPTKGRPYHDRALARWNNGQPVLAMADLDQALKYEPHDLQALTLRGELYLATNDPTRAQADFESATKLAPQDSGLQLQIAGAYSRARRFDDAIRRFDSWIAAHPNDPDLGSVLNSRCWTRALWGKGLDIALADCDAAMKRGLRISAVMDSRGLVLLRLGRVDDAIAQYDSSIRLQPKNPWSLYGRGLAKVKKGAKAEGEADIQAALALQPNLAQQAKSYGIEPEDPSAGEATRAAG
ncbi:MAG: hypothetical protein JWP28_3383 [Phenylobacterium sp.]|jgi:tetratricopeptide (TPR) repeat protein/predicted aspartyl protease|uniref:aspartyl protease family protein n=1 Tax=Phenylobacterium sp. TaxID=1871053 RepID=UPI00260E48C0|nr:aspartyl protease family protein [Phenylobacterium sp.]MDB5464100.1 hypothetical protein [Phenylobacterium sp.]MDB5499352.1 hypothetical protein [Phenylobacterium sp.]